MIEAKVILDSVSPTGKRAPQGARLKKPLKWSDVPCKKGHIGLRYDSGGCVQCSRVSEPKKKQAENRSLSRSEMRLLPWA